MVRDIGKEGVAVVLVEQNVAQALSLAARAYVIAEGRTVMDGDAAEIIAHPDVKRRYLGEL
jgi:branched-chain amino acid transport system ATP-binding protein